MEEKFVEWFFDEYSGTMPIQVDDEPRRYGGYGRLNNHYKDYQTLDEIYKDWLDNIEIK